jgi:aspartate kinase
LEGKREKLLAAIERRAHPDSVTIEDGIAMIAVVGRGMAKAKGTAAKVFIALAHAGINVRMIDQGSSELNVIVGVDEADYETAIRAIYNEFVK